VEQLTPAGLRVVNELAQRYGFSQEAVIHMMFTMLRGRGGMAQFNHPEFAGSGQWMQGGMLMLGDMFNHSLKARVDGLCQAIAAQISSQPELFPSGSFQAQSQSGAGQQSQVATGGQQMPLATQGGLFAADPRDSWWPAELGSPSAMGSQNDIRYAFFPAVGRLAVEANGRVTLYDTGEHHIAGFSQQQSPGGAVVFATPGGSISLANLSAIGSGSQQQQQRSTGPHHSLPELPAEPAPAETAGKSPQDDVFETLAKLGALKEKGILTEEEFAAKKAELLARL
jgi:hypothetical protein